MKRRRVMTHRPCLLLALAMAGCAAHQPLGAMMSPADVPATLRNLAPARLLLLGEQHDADEQGTTPTETIRHRAV